PCVRSRIIGRTQLIVSCPLIRQKSRDFERARRFTRESMVEAGLTIISALMLLVSPRLIFRRTLPQPCACAASMVQPSTQAMVGAVLHSAASTSAFEVTMFILYSFLVWAFRKLTSDVPVAELSGGGTNTMSIGRAAAPAGTSVATVGSGVARGVMVGAGGGGGV